jgi:hydroxyacylglutathione hydrolase
MTMPLDIRLVPMFADNYGFLIRDPESGKTAVVDPGQPEPIIAALEALGWSLELILNTHHHADHVGGNLALKARYGAAVVGPAADGDRIPGLDRGVGEGDLVAIGRHEAQVLEVHGHTRAHIAYWFSGDQAVFCGDTLFALGCGRLFEGTAADMWSSLKKLRALPPDTRVYCAHEYTQANCRFALTVEGSSETLLARAEAIATARAEGLPTVPSTIALERATNPFLRADVPEFLAASGYGGQPATAVFADIRGRKDSFR